MTPDRLDELLTNSAPMIRDSARAPELTLTPDEMAELSQPGDTLNG